MLFFVTELFAYHQQIIKKKKTMLILVSLLRDEKFIERKRLKKKNRALCLFFS
jgi:hypothetical protein